MITLKTFEHIDNTCEHIDKTCVHIDNTCQVAILYLTNDDDYNHSLIQHLKKGCFIIEI